MSLYVPRAFFVIACMAAAACGSRTENVGTYPTAGAGGTGAVGGSAGAPGGAVGPSPFCHPFGQPCASGQDCCSGLCDPASSTCAASINQCTPTGAACTSSTECCSLACTAGHCSALACLADNQACSDSAACCSGTCTAGVCQPLNPSCRTAGNPCAANTECCSSLCQAGVCKLGASFCIQTGDLCSDSSTCCSGDCKTGANGLGTCAAPPSGSTYCSDGVDGTVCSACNGCCSRLCAPYGPTGVKICQPPSGCRVNGDLCRKDSDCCGADGTGLPGAGNVTCEIDAGKTVGICRNPRSCNPQGNVCHYQNYTCSISSARNDCCGGVGNSGVCQVDSLGVPRCNGLGTECRQGGQTCASNMDCCNHVPCVPDASGLLHCYGSPGAGGDAGVPSRCVPSGGACSITGDCCVGTVCLQPVGSTQGVCGIPVSPPTGPTTGLDGGTPDASAPGCAEYGQMCQTDSDCCNGVPCSNGMCVEPIIL